MKGVMEKLKEVKTFLESLNYDSIGQGFSVGFSLYAALPVLRALFQRRSVSSRSWRTAAASGIFFGGFRLISQLLMKLKLRKKTVRALAGATSAAIGLCVDDSFVSSPLVIWWALRAARTVIPKVNHGSVIAMVGATAMLNPSALMFSGEHAPSYQRFMDMMSLGIDRYSLHNPDNLRKGPSIHWPDRGVQTICDSVSFHEGHSSCLRAAATGAFPRLFLISLRLYTPLYLAWTLVRVRFKAKQFVENVLRSSLFLSVYSTGIYLGTFWYTSTINPHMKRAEMMVVTSVAGLSSLIERQERRPELATYCLTHGLNAMWNIAINNKVLPERNRRLGIITMVISTAILMMNHEQQSKFVRSAMGLDL